MLHIIQNITVALYQQNQQEITLIQEVTLVAESVSRNYQHRRRLRQPGCIIIMMTKHLYFRLQSINNCVYCIFQCYIKISESQETHNNVIVCQGFCQSLRISLTIQRYNY